MPTLVHFIGINEPVELEEDYQKVNSQLHGSDTGHFTLARGGLATIYKSSVAYIEERASESGSLIERA
jgi:hypothetical protein